MQGGLGCNLQCSGRSRCDDNLGDLQIALCLQSRHFSQARSCPPPLSRCLAALLPAALGREVHGKLISQLLKSLTQSHVGIAQIPSHPVSDQPRSPSRPSPNSRPQHSSSSSSRSASLQIQKKVGPLVPQVPPLSPSLSPDPGACVRCPVGHDCRQTPIGGPNATDTRQGPLIGRAGLFLGFLALLLF